MKTNFYNMEVDMNEETDLPAAKASFNPLVTPYELDPIDFPRSGCLRDQFVFLLRYAILAPSTHNAQPWKCGLTDEGIAVYADYTRRLRVADPGHRELTMSIGALIMNLRVAAAHFGFASRVDYNYGGDSERPIAFVRLVPRVPREQIARPMAELFPAIVKRHTNRHPFLAARIPKGFLDTIQALARTSQVGMALSTDGGANMRVATLVAAADRMLHADPQFRKELAEWIRPNWTRKSDGMTGAAFGAGSVASALGPWATKTFDLGPIHAIKHEELCAQAPLLVVIHGEDTVGDLLEAGEFMERIFLTAVRDGLQVSFFNMPIQVPDVRTELRSMFSLSGWPQLLLRIGFSLTPPSPSPRRPLEEIICEAGTLDT